MRYTNLLIHSCKQHFFPIKVNEKLTKLVKISQSYSEI